MQEQRSASVQLDLFNLTKNVCNEKEQFNIRKIIDTAGLSINDFKKMLNDKCDINISKSSVRNLLDDGVILKRIPNFKESVEKLITTNFLKEINSLNITDIWANDNFLIGGGTGERSHHKNIFKENTMIRAEILTSETMKHFGLKQNPFNLDIRRESEIFISQSHAYALEVIRETADYGGFAVITGQVGSGKSTIFAKFVEEIKANNRCHIIFPESIDKTRLNAKAILQACIYDLSENKPLGSIEALSRQVKKLLTERSNNNEKTILVIEEAHDLSITTLKFLKRIWEMKSGLARLLGIIIIGQNELETRLFYNSNIEIREVTARITHARVEPMADDVASYINHRLKSAKSKLESIITEEALTELSNKLTIKDRNNKAISNAYPLTINNAMVKLLNYAYLAGETIITKDVVLNGGI